jgi:Zn finger protein HypA/HybF involved in hydrogenase expression
MVIIPKKVNCSVCFETVHTAEARVLSAFDKNPQYECFTCFKQKTLSSPKDQELSYLDEKIDLFCSSCKFKFKSKRLACPYCGKKQHLMQSEISTNELLE